MASDVSPGKILVTSLLQGSQAASSVNNPKSGKPLPPGGKNTPNTAAGVTAGAYSTASAAPAKASTAVAASGTTGTANTAGATGTASSPGTPASKAAAFKAAAVPATDSQSIAAALNKHLNESGRPDQFRVDPASSNTRIQEINPSTGEVVGEFSIDEFPALARSIGATGVLVDTSA